MITSAQWERLRRLFRDGETHSEQASDWLACAALLLLVVFWLFGASGVFGYFPALIAHPAQTWPGLVFAGAFVYSVLRFLHSARRARAQKEDFLLGRTVIKLALGIAAAWCLHEALTLLPDAAAYAHKTYETVRAENSGVTPGR